MDSENLVLANSVKNIRESLGLTQAELAERMGIPASSISRLESGTHTITATTLSKFLKATGSKFTIKPPESPIRSQDISLDQIINYILFVLKQKLNGEYDVSNMKLNKILFFTQWQFLVKHNKPLFPNTFQAWEHGPVIPEVYFKFQSHGRKPIENNIITHSAIIERYLSKEELATINDTLEEYGTKSAYQLRKESHDKIWEKLSRRSRITEYSLKDIQEFLPNKINSKHM